MKDTVSEWLRSWTRNPMGFARRGSNPLGVVFRFSSHVSRFAVHPRYSPLAARNVARRVHGATVARLTPDQTVGRSNRSGLIFCLPNMGVQFMSENSDTGTRTQVAWVKARYPNQLDYIGARQLQFTCIRAASKKKRLAMEL